MGSLKIYNNKLEGVAKIPPSKSMAHRAVICAALSKDKSIITNIDLSDDIIATIDGMRALGAKIEIRDQVLEIIGLDINEDFSTERVIDCNESGSTLRFLVPIASLSNSNNRFIGRGNLGKRPLDIYYNIFKEQGINYSYKESELDLKTKGKLVSGEFEVLGNISSQFITGLMFTLPLLEGDSKIIIKGPLESKGYIDLTLKALADFGVKIENNDYKEFIIKGNQSYIGREYRVEGDYSQGAFFLCADALGNKVVCKDLDNNSLQGDREVIEILERMGVYFNRNEDGIIGVSKSLEGTIIDAKGCPDIIPILSVVASLSEGKTEIINAKRLRIKECDRLSAINLELSKLGAKIEEKEDGLIIYGIDEFKGGVNVWSHKDHRIAMMLAIAATRCKEEIILEDYECVSKSYPSFFEDFKMLGGRVDEWNLGE
ncbi:3-phosphoshikimate 1-carboxyvinyltransferase [Clostridium sardiniense]|uniref:3-phosphoshikimate 1-carboxyvinyltransferase n=1 Tax=Clostridium sardiniense TaxID=29369 RepID=UPI003D356E89